MYCLHMYVFSSIYVQQQLLLLVVVVGGGDDGDDSEIPPFMFADALAPRIPGLGWV